MAGNWEFVSHCKLNYGSINTALDLAQDKRCFKLLIESDNLEAVTLINQGCTNLHYVADMVRMIKLKMQKTWEVEKHNG